MNRICYIIRYGEIAIKKGNRNLFEKELCSQIKEKLNLRDIKNQIKNRLGRIYLIVDDNKINEIELALKYTPGIVSFSKSEIFPRDKEMIEVIKRAKEIFEKSDAKTYRIDANRVDKTYSLTSLEVNIKIAEAMPETKTVDLKNPELNIGVEIGTENIYLYSTKIQSVGGLPIGSSGNSLLFMSGGLDSPIAGYLAMKRGLKLKMIHFLNSEKVFDVPKNIELTIRELTKVQNNIELIMVPFSDIEQEILEKSFANYRIVTLRRLFLKFVEKYSKELKTNSIVTGDNLAQVASQTIENMHAITYDSNLLVLRPVLTYDKREIIDIAREIDTFDASVLPYNDCCSLLVPKNPVIKGKIIEVEKNNQNFDFELIDKLFIEAYNNSKTFNYSFKDYKM
jgi:thiamine biosynthesis protein ThiI